MKRASIHGQLIATLLLAAEIAGAQIASAQIARTRTPYRDAPSPVSGVPLDTRHPYAGLWRGTRHMPFGSDEIALRFTVTGRAYDGATVHPAGGFEVHRKLTASASGLSWEQPNSGGGTWVYHVRLVSPDSMEGTLVLRDAPSQFTTIPRGTLALTRESRPGAAPDN